MITLESFKELMGVDKLTFNQYTEGKRAIADVKGIRVIAALNFDASKPAYLRKGLTDEKGNVLDAEAWLLFNAKDAIASFTI
jgi:hypothetical protein